MANKPVLSEDSWEALRLLSIKGVADSDLATRFDVDPATIRQRRFRDEVWRAAMTGQRGENNALSQKGENVPSSVSLAAKVAATVGESIATLGESNRLLALQLAAKGLKAADAAPPDVTSWQDVKALVDIVHKASGMESGNAVQVNVLSSGGYDFVPASVEAMGI